MVNFEILLVLGGKIALSLQYYRLKWRFTMFTTLWILQRNISSHFPSQALPNTIISQKQEIK